ncbi:MAG: lysophospholipid acyltransferase family protein, partial [Pseudomonadota bacterium]
AQRDGTGLLSVTGHFGQWEATRAFLKARGGSVAALYRPMKNPFSDRFLTARYAAFGSPMFPKGRQGTRGLVLHLSQGGTLGIMHDQKIDEGVLLPFLGRPAPTALLAAELALKFKLPLLPAYAWRDADLETIHFEVEPPIPPSTPAEMMTAVNHSLARRVAARPEQYYWLHRRWQIRNPKHIAELPGWAGRCAPVRL